MTSAADTIAAPQRARVRQLAGHGVPVEDIRQLCGHGPDGVLLEAAAFRETFARELALGAAEANAEVSKALFAQATSGKAPTVTLAWAKHRLDWREDKEESADAADTGADSLRLVAALQNLLDQLAAAKAGGDRGAAALAAGGPAQPAAPAE